MDNVQRENLQKYLQHVSLWYSVIKHKLEQPGEIDAETLSLLRGQHDTNQRLLADFGIEFEEKDRIRSLNMQVRELELKVGQNSGVDFGSIAHFNNSMKDKAETALDAIGLNASVSVECSTALTVTLTIYGQSQQPSSTFEFFKSDEEKAACVEKYRQRIARLVEHFDYSGNHAEGKGDLTVLYTPMNMNLIGHTLSHALGVDLGTPDTEIRADEGCLELQKVTYTALLLEQDKNFRQAMHERY